MHSLLGELLKCFASSIHSVGDSPAQQVVPVGGKSGENWVAFYESLNWLESLEVTVMPPAFHTGAPRTELFPQETNSWVELRTLITSVFPFEGADS